MANPLGGVAPLSLGQAANLPVSVNALQTAQVKPVAPQIQWSKAKAGVIRSLTEFCQEHVVSPPRSALVAFLGAPLAGLRCGK